MQAYFEDICKSLECQYIALYSPSVTTEVKVAKQEGESNGKAPPPPEKRSEMLRYDNKSLAPKLIKSVATTATYGATSTVFPVHPLVQSPS